MGGSGGLGCTESSRKPGSSQQISGWAHHGAHQHQGTHPHHRAAGATARGPFPGPARAALTSAAGRVYAYQASAW